MLGAMISPRAIIDARTKLEQTLGDHWDTHMIRLNTKQLRNSARHAAVDSVNSAAKANALQKALEQTTAKLLDAQHQLELQKMATSPRHHREAPSLVPESPAATIARRVQSARPYRAPADTGPSKEEQKREARLRCQVGWVRFHAKPSPRPPEGKNSARACLAPGVYWDGPRRPPPKPNAPGVQCYNQPAPPRAGPPPEHDPIAPRTPSPRQPPPLSPRANAARAAAAASGNSLRTSGGQWPVWATASWISRQGGRPAWQHEREARERALKHKIMRAYGAAEVTARAPAEEEDDDDYEDDEAPSAAEAALDKEVTRREPSHAHALPDPTRRALAHSHPPPARSLITAPCRACACISPQVLSLHALLKHKIETRFHELRRAFRLIDQDKSGSCDRHECKRMLLQMFNIVVPEPVIDRMLDLIDVDNDGEIVLAEFNAFFSTTEPLDLRQRIAQLRRRQRRGRRGAQRGARRPSSASPRVCA